MGGWLSRLGAFCVAWRWPVLAVWIILAFGLTFLTDQLPSTSDNQVVLPGTGSQQAYDLLQQNFPPQQNGSNPAVYHAVKGTVDDKGPNQAAITQAYRALKNDKTVYSATNPFENPQAGLVSKDHKYAFIPVVLKIDSQQLTEHKAQELYQKATAAPKHAGLQSAMGGAVGNALDPPDTGPSERLGMLAAAFILALTFGSLVAMGMPLVSAVLGLLLGLAGIWLLGNFAGIPSIGVTLARMIGLGVGIDYALFLVSRHRRYVQEGVPPKDAAARAVGTSGGAIIFAGGTVVLALLSLQVAGIPFIAGLGYACAVAVLGAVLAAITLLPAILGILGRSVVRVNIPGLGRRTEHPVGRAWARLVTAKPWLTVPIAVALLVPLILPIRTLVLGQQDPAVAPPGSSELESYDLMSAGFGPGYNGPLLVATQIEPPAEPSSQYDKQYDKATSLQQQLEAEQKSLTQQEQELEQQQALLEQQAAELEAEAAGLEAEKAVLQAEAAALQQQAEALKREGKQLRDQARQLREQARKLVRKEVKLARKLVRHRVAVRSLERRIERARTPERRELLTERLQLREQQAKQLRKQLKRNTKKIKALRPKARALVRSAEALEEQAAALARQAAGILEQGAALVAEAEALKMQQAALEAEAASLQDWADELQVQANQAKKQQKQAEQLQAELTDELTKAGGDPRGTDPRIVKLQDALATPKDVQLVGPPQINKDGDVFTLSVIPKTDPAAPATAALVQQERNQVIPGAVSPGMDSYVGGSTASNVDLATLIGEKLLLVILTIIALASILLLVAFRSLLIPVQAAFANLLAAGAAFGIVTTVFQWGWGLSAIGLDAPSGSVPVASYVPLMMFAALFGLSMDYQVFVMSTIQGEVAAGRSPREAVRTGLADSAKIVVSAALIMMSVFGSFILNDDSIVKEFGVGLTVAVGLAAFMVLCFAPALLMIFNTWTWRLPRFLDRLLPDLDLEGRALEARLAAAAAPGVVDMREALVEEPAAESATRSATADAVADDTLDPRSEGGKES